MRRLLLIARATPADPDADLLARFLGERDEAAFAELVRRHAPVVWGVCRRRLADPRDAEDAFQAAFLVLVRRARRAAAHPALGPWLYRVAVLTARNLARANRRRKPLAGPLDGDIAIADPGPGTDTRLDLDDALLSLSDRQRAAVVLCHLQGLTHKEAAARLGCPVGTLSAAVSAALRKLRARLGGRDPLAVFAAAGACVPAGLSAAAARVAAVYTTSALRAGVSPAVLGLTEGVLRMVWVKKLTAAGVILAAAGAIGLGVIRTADAGGEEPGAKPAATAEKPAADVRRELEGLRRENERLRETIRQLQGRAADGPGAAGPKAEVEEARKRSAFEASMRGRPKAHFRLVVGGPKVDDRTPPYRVEEMTTQGIWLPYLTGHPQSLARLLTRARGDPAEPAPGRKAIHVEAGASATPRQVYYALRAVREAGFEWVTYAGPLDGDLRNVYRNVPADHQYVGGGKYTGPVNPADLPKDEPAEPDPKKP